LGQTVFLPDVGVAAFGIPIVTFVDADYWHRWYVDRPWYRDHVRWEAFKRARVGMGLRRNRARRDGGARVTWRGTECTPRRSMAGTGRSTTTKIVIIATTITTTGAERFWARHRRPRPAAGALPFCDRDARAGEIYPFVALNLKSTTTG
jgi:hypothetical protein